MEKQLYTVLRNLLADVLYNASNHLDAVDFTSLLDELNYEVSKYLEEQKKEQ